VDVSPPQASTPADALAPATRDDAPAVAVKDAGRTDPQLDLLPVFAKAVDALPELDTPVQRLEPDVEAIEFDGDLIHTGITSGPDWLGPPAAREGPAEGLLEPSASDPLAALEQADWTLSDLAPVASPGGARVSDGPGQPPQSSYPRSPALPIATPAPPPPAEPMAAADDELIGIFLDEADEVLATIAEQAACAEAMPQDQAPLGALRRAFHTLKGSSRMVGLEAFGAAAWAMEELFNDRMALGGRPDDPDLLDLVGRAHGEMIGWVAGLRAGQHPAIDPAPLVRAARALREGQPLPPPHEAARAPVAVIADEGDSTVVDPMVASPEREPAALLQDEPEAERLDEPEAVLLDEPEAVLLDEPEAVLLDEPEAVLLDEPEAVLLDEPEAVLLDEPEAVLLDEPEAVRLDEPEAMPAPAAAPPAAPDTVRIGDRVLSRPLYLIFLSEADELIAALRADVENWRADPGRDVSADALRAAHSLSGGAAVMQLDTVHRLAHALERAYRRQSQSRQGVTSDELARVAMVIDRIHGMLHRFAGGDWPLEDPGLLAELEELSARWSGEVMAPSADDPDAAEGVAAELAEPPPADEIDPELLPIFLEEAADDLPRIGESLRAWAAAPHDAGLPQRLMRILHTVKGSARMAGAMHLGQLLHDAETRVDELAALADPDLARIEELIAHTDKAMALFDALRRPVAQASAAPVPATATATAAADAPSAVPSSPSAESALALPLADPSGSGSPPASEALPGPAVALPPLSPAAPALPPAAAAAPAPLVRVRADLLDRLVNEAGEVSISRSRLDNELSVLRQSLLELTENVGRLRAQLREIEIQADTQIQARIAQQKDHERTFDPLEFDRYTRFQELTRMLAESVNDVATVQGHAMRSLDGAGQDLHRQGQVLRDLQQDLMRARMVQFGSIADRLYRVVRRAAKETDKRVNLDIRGATVEVDRGVLERMAGPIEHLLRNSVAHGIELPAVRQARGKPETGEIRVEVRQEGREIVLSFADDGGGLDLARIRQRALAQSLIAENAKLSDRELADLIFVQGFSTAASVTELSGRGVGMDVVRAEVASLGGRIETETETGRGTRFTVHLPLTLAVSQVVLLSAGRSRFAVPSSSVEQVLQLKPQALADAYAQHALPWQEQVVPLFYLGGLAGLPDLVPLAQHLSPVVIIRAGHQRIAVHADEVTRNQEVVVKSVGAQAARVPGLTGATVLGNGDIVLIVNLVVLAKMAAGESLERSLPAPAIEAVMPEALPPLVMVVDDSLTVRKVTQRLLSREGYQVLLARDGVDALRQLEEVVPDAMLLDIEMPRMDGFELLRHLRADARLARIPIVMITSRTADKHRNHALELGVDAYLGKPYPEDELLALLARFTRPVPRQANSG
jgi:chemosensory pili system protein ChpA (sensor histidine kinase/response regulator)